MLKKQSWAQIEKNLKITIAELLDVSEKEIGLRSSFSHDLGADSLDLSEIIATIEGDYRIELPLDSNDDKQSKAFCLEHILTHIFKLAPEEIKNNINSQIVVFRIREDGKIQVGLQQTDGTWVYADGTSKLPCGLYLTVFSKWDSVLNELEEIINYPTVKEVDLQKFFEEYPELLKGDEFDFIIPQARIVKKDCEWRADFILSPHSQTSFCKILELKLPKAPIIKNERSCHTQFYKNLHEAIMQLQDYGEAFQSDKTREKFKRYYNVEVYKPDLELIIGRKWDILHIQEMLEMQRRNNVFIKDWDTHLEQLRKKFL